MEVLEFRLPAKIAHLRVLRRSLRQGLQDMGVAELPLDRLLLVVDEVVSNAIEHGQIYRRSAEPILVQVHRQDRGLLLSIEDADVPAAVVINEYVDVAHAFFDDDVAAMVNGVLDRIAHGRVPGAARRGSAP